MHLLVSAISVLLAAVLSANAYFIVLNQTISRESIIFDGSLSTFKQPLRRYFMNVDKSASFVKRLLHVNASTGAIQQKESFSCDRSLYPKVFTLYIDSSSSCIYEYVSVPLKVYIQGCEDESDAGTVTFFLSSKFEAHCTYTLNVFHQPQKPRTTSSATRYPNGNNRTPKV